MTWYVSMSKYIQELHGISFLTYDFINGKFLNHNICVSSQGYTFLDSFVTEIVQTILEDTVAIPLIHMGSITLMQ